MLEALRRLPRDTVSLVDETQAFTTGQLADAIEQERAWLKQQGGTRYALLADNGAPWIIADIALLAAKIMQVPLPGSFTAAQTEHVLRDAGIDRILTDQPDRVLAQIKGLAVLGRAPASGLSVLGLAVADTPAVVPDGTVKVTYTSGSTGTPKGVCLGAEGLMTVARTLAGSSAAAGVSRHLCQLPLPTLLENLAGVYAPLLAGATCIVPRLSSVGMNYGGLDSARLLAAITHHEPSSLILVPELLKLLVVAAERGWAAPRSLAFIAVGGAQVPREMLVRAHASGLPAYEGYGLTECTSVVSLNLPGATRLGSTGRPLPHVKVRIDAAGEIHVSGSLLLGYLGEAGSSLQEVATGDLGELDGDGFLTVQGRLRNIFITSLGRNLSPEWIESALLKESVIGQAVVTGESRPYVVAVISPSAPGLPESVIERAIEQANLSLPDYAQVRGWILATRPFSPAEGLLTANGRPRRAAIMTAYATAIAACYDRDDAISSHSNAHMSTT